MDLLNIEKEEFREYINTDVALEVLSSDCLFAEGPVWNEKGFYLFSDIPANIINKIVPGQPKEIYLQQSGCSNPAEAELPRMMGSNGLAYDAHGNLLICQHGNHCVALYSDKEMQPFITEYNGRPFNSPNDIVGHYNRIFFSDPPYGLKDQALNPNKYQPKAGFYCWQDGAIRLFCDQYQYPNGLCISADEKYLYTCSNKPFEAVVLEFDLKDLSLRREVCRESSDGIKCDQHGNLYLCNKDGILIYNNKGERLGSIRLPTAPANCCWGGKDVKDLFITARENIFLIRNLQK